VEYQHVKKNVKKWQTITVSFCLGANKGCPGKVGFDGKQQQVQNCLLDIKQHPGKVGIDENHMRAQKTIMPSDFR
jgi:hypothetical protein